MQTTSLTETITQSFPNDREKVQEVLSSLQVTQSEFCPGKTLEEIWDEEKHYYIQHGMSAFDCGYCGKELDVKGWKFKAEKPISYSVPERGEHIGNPEGVVIKQDKVSITIEDSLKHIYVISVSDFFRNNKFTNN